MTRGVRLYRWLRSSWDNYARYTQNKDDWNGKTFSEEDHIEDGYFLSDAELQQKEKDLADRDRELLRGLCDFFDSYTSGNVKVGYEIIEAFLRSREGK